MDKDRRRFLELLGIALGGAALFVAGCGGGSSKLPGSTPGSDTSDEKPKVDIVKEFQEIDKFEEELEQLSTVHIPDVEAGLTEFLPVSSEGISTLATTLTVGVALGSNTPKNITIYYGDKVLTAIKKACTYTKNADGTTTINGIKGKWAYTINGYLPTGMGSSASDLGLTKNCTIRLYRIVTA